MSPSSTTTWTRITIGVVCAGTLVAADVSDCLSEKGDSWGTYTAFQQHITLF